MNVGELKQIIADLPDDMPVCSIREEWSNGFYVYDIQTENTCVGYRRVGVIPNDCNPCHSWYEVFMEKFPESPEFARVLMLDLGNTDTIPR
jgi:hypothetical protein